MTAATLRIGSGDDRLEIEVVGRREDGVASVLRLTLHIGRELVASCGRAVLIPEADEAARLAAFFEDIAQLHWTGWLGAKSWANLEHNLEVAGTWHRTGGATLGVKLMSEESGRWTASGVIVIGDMELERLGPAARAVILGHETSDVRPGKP
jgi:hypothetical protein